MADMQYVSGTLPAQSLRDEVLQGLAGRPRAIAPKWFYDAHGAELFEAICTTPEYYVTRTECGILQRHGAEMARLIGPGTVLLEPGSGASTKVRLLLDALRPHAYLPIDICGEQLEAVAQGLADSYPWLEVTAIHADFTCVEQLPAGLPDGRRVVFFPGSTLGNFEPTQAVRLLRCMGRLAGSDGFVLIGIDLKKSPELLDAAYNDGAGLTAAFNRNLLHRIQRELKAEIEPDGFRHHAFYNDGAGRVEMHLVSETRQAITIDEQRFTFDPGEGIHTENSYKYTVPQFQSLARRAGLLPLQVWCDPRQLFSVHLLAVGH